MAGRARKGTVVRRRKRVVRAALYKAPTLKRNLERLATNVLTLRHQRRWTQEDAAHEAGFPLAMWQRIESGRTNPTLLTLGRVADALGVEVVDLLRKR
jgi:DNA-binding XRE family transcriptional regulator